MQQQHTQNLTQAISNNQSSNNVFKQQRYLNNNGGSGQYNKDSLLKSYNNYVLNNGGNSNNQGGVGNNNYLLQQNQHSALSKSTLQSLEKLRNVRSLTPDKQQFLLNPQQVLNKASQLQQTQVISNISNNQNFAANFAINQSSPNGSTNNINKSSGGTANKKYSLSQTMQQIQQQQQNKSKINSNRTSQSKSIGPIINNVGGSNHNNSIQGGNQNIQQQSAFYQQNSQLHQQQQLKQQSHIQMQYQQQQQQTQQNFSQLSSSAQLIINHQSSSENPNMNVSIDNLSTLRSSEVNEREKNLLEKIKYYKKENSKLIALMRESENSILDRISKQKKETEQILKILNKLWPLMVKLIQMDQKSIDQTTKEVLMTLGEMLGKDITQLSISINENIKLQNDNKNENKILGRECEFLKKELLKQKIEVERLKKLNKFQNLKNDLIIQEMMKLIEYQERQTETFQYKMFCITDDKEEVNSLLKLQFLEDQVAECVQYDINEIEYQSKVSSILEKIQKFEKDYFLQIESDISSKIIQSSETSLFIGQSPNPHKDIFDTEITLLNSGNNYIVKNQGGTVVQQKNNHQQKESYINVNVFNVNEPATAQPKFSLQKQSQQLPISKRDQSFNIVNTSGLGKSTNNLNMSINQHPGTDNISLPDISSTEIAPNKLSAPNKIINFNHARGLQAYQKQLGRDGSIIHTQGYIEELGGFPLDINGSLINDSNHLKIGTQISLKNNMNVLRNRSTSPTIIPKKNLVRKELV